MRLLAALCLRQPADEGSMALAKRKRERQLGKSGSGSDLPLCPRFLVRIEMNLL